MNRRDEQKTSLVDFLRSIKFARAHTAANKACATHFARFNQRVRLDTVPAAEDCQLVRSAN